MYINNQTLPNNINFHVKELNITLDNCEKHGLSGGLAPLYCGGYFYCTDTNAGIGSYIDNINVVINSGRYFYYNDGETAVNGNGIYLGGFTYLNGTSVIGNINCEVNGGEFNNLYGGPGVQDNGIGIVTGDTHLYINGGEFNAICGMGSRTASNGLQRITTSGTIYIHINGGIFNRCISFNAS